MNPDNKPPRLRRSLSLSLVTYYGLGNILGAGIYVLIGEVAAEAGAQAPLSFLLASLLAGLSAFSYAELSSRYPFSAGEVVYLQQGLGIKALSWLVGVLIVMAGVVSAATITRGFVGYLQVFVPIADVTAMVLLVAGLTALAVWGISQSVMAASLMTLFEVAGLLLILWVARPGTAALLGEMAALGEWQGWPTGQGIFLGAFLAFYAFIGFEDMVNVAEEVRDPRRNLPRAIVLALGISTLLYFAVALVAVSVVAPEELAQSDAPLAFLYRRAGGADPVLITVISLVAVINGALIQIIMASRVCYGMARKGWLPAIMGRVNPLTRTPLIGTLIIALGVLVMALWLPLASLARATSFFILIVFALVNLSLWRIKMRETQTYTGFSIPVWVPAAGVLGALTFIVLQTAASLA